MAVLHFFLVNSPLIYILFSLDTHQPPFKPSPSFYSGLSHYLSILILSGRVFIYVHMWGGAGPKVIILIQTKNLFRFKLTFKLFLVWLPECRRRRSILVLLPNLVKELLLSLQLLLLASQLLLLSFYLLPLLLNPTQDKYYSFKP